MVDLPLQLRWWKTEEIVNQRKGGRLSWVLLEENGILVKADYFTEIKCDQISAFIDCLFLQRVALSHHQSKLLLLLQSHENMKDYCIPSTKNLRKKLIPEKISKLKNNFF